jgi:hypothetical protein
VNITHRQKQALEHGWPKKMRKEKPDKAEISEHNQICLVCEPIQGGLEGKQQISRYTLELWLKRALSQESTC